MAGITFGDTKSFSKHHNSILYESFSTNRIEDNNDREKKTLRRKEKIGNEGNLSIQMRNIFSFIISLCD